MATRLTALAPTALLAALLLNPLLATPARATNFSALTQCTRAPVKAWMFFTVGHASLYRSDCHAPDPLAPPMRLAFGYNREVPGDAFGKSALAMIKRNVSATTFGQLEARINTFNSHYQTTTDGDLYTLDYDSDQSLVLKLNGTTLATERGAGFARAYFTIWFGDDPFSDELKKGLLPGSD